MDKNNTIDYSKLVDEAMHIIVCKVLKYVEKRGLPGDHHFFISFLTNRPGVALSHTLTKMYPKEMTIVLQYQFQNLVADKKGFGVVLSFNGVKEKIYIPYSAITTFADPSVQFGLQFREIEDSNDEEDYFDLNSLDNLEKKAMTRKKGKKTQEEAASDNNVVSFEEFLRKK